MFLVNHHCPQCGGVFAAPMAGLMAGDAGIWVCDQCDSVYEIRIDFKKVDLDEALARLKRTRVAQGARVDPKEPSPAAKGPRAPTRHPEDQSVKRRANEQS